jgi:hypothetical protein
MAFNPVELLRRLYRWVVRRMPASVSASSPRFLPHHFYRCRSCSEPATLLCHLSRPGSTAEDYYCYIHAVEAGLIEIPIEDLRPLSVRSGYSVNAVIFVMEVMNATERFINARDICFSC